MKRMFYFKELYKRGPNNISTMFFEIRFDIFGGISVEPKVRTLKGFDQNLAFYYSLASMR